MSPIVRNSGKIVQHFALGIIKSLIYATQQQDGEGYLVLIGKGKLEAGTKRIQSAKTHTPLGQIIGILLIRPGSNVTEPERQRS